MTVLLPLWRWAKAHPVLAFIALPLLIVIAVLLVLWRIATGQRDRARRERDDARAREAAARESAQRGEALRVDEDRARREHEAAVREVTDRRVEVEARASEARADLWDARTEDELARIVNERKRDRRLP